MKLKKGRRLRKKLSNRLMRIYSAEVGTELANLPEGEELDVIRPLTRLVSTVFQKPETEARLFVISSRNNLARKGPHLLAPGLHELLAFYIKSERPRLSDEEVWAIVDDLAARAERGDPDIWVRIVVGNLIEIATREETLMPTDEHVKYLADVYLGHMP